ncbi:MAG TPA: YdeI/OmpD-associated family protein [Cyclobacteriaceae bacterium]|nr:YdeI/OmpD-associated family protein [Cyclobacteriaceae bacterium]
MNPKVDWFFERAGKWQKEVNLLRTIVLDCGLKVELNWGCPCYTFEGANVVLIHTFKEYCALLFFKGALLKDPKKILIQQTKNVQAARQIRFTNLKEVEKLKASLKTYIYNAIKAEESGLKVKLKKTTEFEMPEEFRKKLSKNSALKKAFYALTPGRQRGYLLYFSSAKQEKTRQARIEKYTKQILDGKGLEDE